MKTRLALLCLCLLIFVTKCWAASFVENRHDKQMMVELIGQKGELTSLDQNSLTKLFYHVDVAVLNKSVEVKTTIGWYYPNKEIVQDDGVESLSFNQHTDEIVITNAGVMSPKGEFSWLREGDVNVIDSDTINVFSESKNLIVSYPKLQAGSVSVIEYIRKTDLNKLEGTWSRIFYPQNLTDTLSFKLNVNWQAEKPLQYFNASPDVTCQESTRSLTCKGALIKALDSDDNFHYRDRLQNIVLTQATSWQQVKGIVLNGFNKARSENQGINEVMSELVNTDMGLAQKITAIHEFVARDVRYVSMSEAGHAITPHNVSTTLDRRFGDCKDKSALLLEMLENIGVEAYPVLIATQREMPEAVKVPSTGYFNHVVVCFDYQNTQHCIDATDAYTDWSVVSDWVQGKVSLALHNAPKPETLQKAKYRWKLNAKIDIQLLETGGQIEKQTVAFVGEYASAVRQQIAGATKKERREWLEEVYHDVVNEEATPTFQVNGLHTLPSDVVVESEVEYDPYFDPSEGIVLTEFSPWISSEIEQFEFENTTYSEVFDGFKIVSEMIIRFPDIWSAQSLPADLNLVTEYGSLTREAKRNGTNTIIVKTVAEMPARVISVQEAEQFNAILASFKNNSSVEYTANKVE
ncbi:hypothetical protein GCM10009114_26410 [Aliiglaciecola litoralis]|uniref:DUF3857 domain-containing protein n=2 Tax=Aliiglaciecola litoralis TaxID=582857 RepID=A0ABP3X2D1_9ALTE